MIFVGAGAYSGCAYCTQKGEYSKALSKMVYLEHRSFLLQVIRFIWMRSIFQQKAYVSLHHLAARHRSLIMQNCKWAISVFKTKRHAWH